MSTDIPYGSWEPLTLAAVLQLLADAPYTWGIAGGYAIEQFVATPIRDHADMDIMVFRDEQLHVHSHLADWLLYAADPPGTLRPWTAGEYLPYGIHDVWGHRLHARAWELQIMLAETDGAHWFMRKNPQIRGLRNELLVQYDGVPCIRVEVQLLYKARGNCPKDRYDFDACLPHLSGSTKQWLKDNLMLLYPAGHPWLEELR